MNYSKERKNEVYNKYFRPFEIIIKAGEDPKSEESKIIKRFFESIFYNLLYIDESVVIACDLGEDQMITYDEQKVYEKSNVNSYYLKAIAKHIPQISNYSDTGIKVEDVILREKESRQNDQGKIEINFDWLLYQLGKYSQIENYPSLQMSGLTWLNYLLNLKIHFTQEFFPQLIDLFKFTNNLGTEDTIILLKFLIKKYKDALSPDNQLSILSTFISDDKGFEVCKETSDEYSRLMLNLYQSKLFHLQGIKEDIIKVEKQIERPLHQNIDKITKIIDEKLDYLTTLNPKGESIMTIDEYEKLKKYVIALIINDDAPRLEPPIRRLNISNQTIIYSFYQIHKEVFSTGLIRNSFIEFLHNTFTQLEKYTKPTIKTKFSVKPKRYPY
jgi:hypothetical protein